MPTHAWIRRMVRIWITTKIRTVLAATKKNDCDDCGDGSLHAWMLTLPLRRARRFSRASFLSGSLAQNCAILRLASDNDATPTVICDLPSGVILGKLIPEHFIGAPQ